MMLMRIHPTTPSFWAEHRRLFESFPEHEPFSSVPDFEAMKRIGQVIPRKPESADQPVSKPTPIAEASVTDESEHEQMKTTEPTPSPEAPSARETLSTMRGKIEHLKDRRTRIDRELMPLIGCATEANRKGFHDRVKNPTESQESNYRKYQEAFGKLPNREQKSFAAVTDFHEQFLAELKGTLSPKPAVAAPAVAEESKPKPPSTSLAAAGEEADDTDEEEYNVSDFDERDERLHAEDEPKTEPGTENETDGSDEEDYVVSDFDEADERIQSDIEAKAEARAKAGKGIASVAIAAQEGLKPIRPESAESDRRIDSLAQAHFGQIDYLKSEWDSLKAKQHEEFAELRDRRSRKPFSFWNSFDDKPGSWPDQVYSEYEKTFKTSNGKIDDHVVYAFNRLGAVLNDYYDLMDMVYRQVKTEHREKLKTLIARYPLPSGFDLVKDLSPTRSRLVDRGYRAGYVTEKNPSYSNFEISVPSEFKTPAETETFFENHFKTFPEKASFARWEELEAAGKDARSISRLRDYFSGLKDPEILVRINSMIQLRNMNRLWDESEKLKASLPKSFEDAIQSLNAKYPNYYNAPQADKKAFIASIIKSDNNSIL